MNERRQNVRLETAVNVEYDVLKSPIEGICQTKNVSTGGLKLPIDAELEEGTLLEVKLHLTHEELPIYATGEVVWIREANKSWEGKYDIGIRFAKIDDLDKNRILALIYNSWVNNEKAAAS